MKFRSYFIFILLLFFCNSCATKALWDNTDPNKFVSIKFSQISEEELIENEVRYIKDNRNRAFYVEKDSFDKLKDYTYRVLGTPLTLAIDAAIIVIVAVGISGNLYIESGGMRGAINL